MDKVETLDPLQRLAVSVVAERCTFSEDKIIELLVYEGMGIKDILEAHDEYMTNMYSDISNEYEHEMPEAELDLFSY